MLNRQSVPKAGLLFSHRLAPAFLALFISQFLLAGNLQAQTGYYHLVAGSFADFQSASKMTQALEARSYDPVILFPTLDSKNYRVSIYHSLNKPEIQTYLTQLKKAGINTKSFWILTQQEALASTGMAQARVSDGAARGTGSFHLVSGSFQQFDKANQAKIAMEAQGFEPTVLFPDSKDGSYRVSIYNSPNRKEVETYSTMLKKRGKNPGWIFEDNGMASAAVAAKQATAATNGRMSLGPNASPAAAPSTAARVSNVTYHLIGGSYKNFSQANDFSEALKGKGFDPLIMFPEPGISSSFRVSVYRSTDKAQVSAFQKNQESQKKLKKSWVYEQR